LRAALQPKRSQCGRPDHGGILEPHLGDRLGHWPLRNRRGVRDEGFLDALNDSVIIAESALTATALSSLITLAAGRPRPFLYGDKAPLRERESPDAGFSFVSSHASVSAASSRAASSTIVAAVPTPFPRS
jgi:membrane-associated phospholipid phosphatase